MNIEKANLRITEIDNEINNFLNKKEELMSEVLPKANTYEEDIVNMTRENKNKNLYYLIENEEIDKSIDYLYKEKEILTNFIDKELHRLKIYHEIETLIIYYRDQQPKKYTWEAIAKKVSLSERQCRKIYKRIKNTRCI